MYQKASTNTPVDWVQSLLEANLDIPINEPGAAGLFEPVAAIIYLFSLLYVFFWYLV